MTRRRLAGRALAAALALAAAGCGGGERAAARFEPDSIPEGHRPSTAALAWPGATRAFQVLPSGDLTNGDWMVRIRPSSEGVAAQAPRVVAFEERRLPVAHWTRRAGTVRWDFEGLAVPESEIADAAYRGTAVQAPRDSGLLVTIEVRATNLGGAPASAALDLALTDLDPEVAFVAFDAPDTLNTPLDWAGDTPTALVHGWVSEPGRGPEAQIAWRLAPGESRVARCVVPAYPTPAAALAAFVRVPHERRARQSRAHWEREFQAGTRLELGDPEVEHAVDAALGVLLVCRERRGEAWVPIGGPLHYRDVWLRDGARAIAALSMMSRTREARALAKGLLAFQWPHGAFLSQRGQLDGTGQALWAFEQALLRPAKAESLDAFLTASLAAVGWCERQRELGRASALPFGTMLPFGDPRDNERVTAQLVGNDAWAIAGYRSAARLLRAAGRSAEADTVERARARYVADFEAALVRTGSPDVPPSWQGVGRDWGNLTVTSPCGVLPASHPRASALAERVWRDASGAGLAIYADRDSVHYYLGADLGVWALLAGRRAEADSVLDAMLEWRSASGGAAEIIARSTRDFGANPPPHATSASALIALVRASLLHDDDDTLRLTMGARERWWRGAQVRKAATRFGTLDLSFSRTGDRAEWKWTAVPVWTVLTLPPGTRRAGAPEPPLVAGDREDQALAPPGSAGASVLLAPAPGANALR